MSDSMFSYAEMLEKLEAQPDWTKYPHIAVQDGLVHRVVRVHSTQLMLQVHDEVEIAYVPITGCGMRLPTLAKDMEDRTPEDVGFCSEDVPLSCVRCASGLAEDGDRERAEIKNRMFGALYGKSGNVLAGQIGAPRQTGKSYSLKRLAQQFLGPIRHRMPAAPSPRPGRWVRRMLARAVWALP